MEHTWHVCKIYKTYSSGDRTHCQSPSPLYTPVDMWSIMVVIFENGNYIYMYKGHLENKTTIKVLVFGDIYLTKYMGKQLIYLEGWNFG